MPRLRLASSLFCCGSFLVSSSGDPGLLCPPVNRSGLEKCSVSVAPCVHTPGGSPVAFNQPASIPSACILPWALGEWRGSLQSHSCWGRSEFMGLSSIQLQSCWMCLTWPRSDPVCCLAVPDFGILVSLESVIPSLSAHHLVCCCFGKTKQ